MKRQPQLAVICALLLAAVPACTETGLASRSASRDSAGVRIAESVNPRWGHGQQWVVESKPILAVGNSVVGTEFTSIAGVFLMKDSMLVVVDRRRAQALFFGPRGDLQRTVGRPGEGPGEFRAIHSAFRLSDHELVVWDPSGRATQLSSDGRVLQVREIRSVTDVLGLLGDGSLLGRVYERASRSAYVTPDAAPRLKTDSIALHRVAADKDETVPLVRLPSALTASPTSYSLPFGPRLVVRTLGDTVVTVFTQEYRIDLRDRTGALVASYRREVRPQPVSVPDFRRATEEQISSDGGSEPLNAALRRRADLGLYPSAHPIILNLLVSIDGFIWAQVNSHPVGDQLIGEARSSSPEWDVFSREGQYLGRVSLEPSTTLLEVGADYVLIAKRDTLDVPRIQLHRLRKQSE